MTTFPLTLDSILLLLLLLTLLRVTSSAIPIDLRVQLHASGVSQHHLSPVHELFQYISGIQQLQHRQQLYQQCMRQYINLNENASLLDSTLSVQFDVVSALLSDEHHCPLTALQRQTFQTSLALHVYGPQLETYRQTYHNILDSVEQQRFSDCLHMLHLQDGSVHCVAPHQPQLAAASVAHQHFNYDITYTGDDTGNTGLDSTAVLYSDLLDTTHLTAVHSTIQQHFHLHSYVIRPVRLATGPTTTQPLWLQGFGIELQLKNMEYKVVDDSQRAEEQQSTLQPAINDKELENVTLDDSADTGGIIFSTLKHRYHSNATALRSLQAAKLQLQHQQQATNSKANEIKAWQLQQLGTQLIQYAHQSHTPPAPHSSSDHGTRSESAQESGRSNH